MAWTACGHQAGFLSVSAGSNPPAVRLQLSIVVRLCRPISISDFGLHLSQPLIGHPITSNRKPMANPEGLTKAEYEAIVSDAAADALLDCGAYCWEGRGNLLGFAIALAMVIAVT